MAFVGSVFWFIIWAAPFFTPAGQPFWLYQRWIATASLFWAGAYAIFWSSIMFPVISGLIKTLESQADTVRRGGAKRCVFLPSLLPEA